MQDHRHCLGCGKLISPKDAFCGEKCMEEFKIAHKRAAFFSKIWTVSLIVLISALIIATLLK